MTINIKLLTILKIFLCRTRLQFIIGLFTEVIVPNIIAFHASPVAALNNVKNAVSNYIKLAYSSIFSLSKIISPNKLTPNIENINKNKANRPPRLINYGRQNIKVSNNFLRVFAFLINFITRPNLNILITYAIGPKFCLMITVKSKNN